MDYVKNRFKCPDMYDKHRETFEKVFKFFLRSNQHFEMRKAERELFFSYDRSNFIMKTVCDDIIYRKNSYTLIDADYRFPVFYLQCYTETDERVFDTFAEFAESFLLMVESNEKL